MPLFTRIHVFVGAVEQKYDLNRFNRRTVRTDIPVARVVQTEEEIRLQQERMEQLQRNTEMYVTGLCDCDRTSVDCL